MIRSTFVFVLISWSILSVNAQKQDDEEPLYARAGFKGGISYTSITGDLDNTGSRVRVHLGAVVEYPLSRKFYIQGELLYAAQGYTVEVEGNEQKVSLNYLSLPIISKFYVTETISLETGPQFSLLNSITNDDVDDADPFFNSFNDLDISWGFGAGYKLESGLFFQLRYNLGISNISDNTIAKRNAVVQLSVGYLFKTKNNRRISDEYYE